MTQEPKRLSTKTWMMLGALILFLPLLAVVVTLVKQPHRAGFMDNLNLQSVKFGGVRSKVSPDLADAGFPEENWDPKILEMLADMPLLVPENSDFKVAPPPANLSAETQTDLDTMRLYQKNLRTPEQLELIDAENSMSKPYEAFEKNGLFVSASNKDTADLLDMALREASYFVVKYKKDFMRIRPSGLAPDLKLVFDNPGHPAYPSGHAAQGYMTALVLSLVDPAHAEQYKALGFDIGLRREIAGVHYPSDSVAGRNMAQAIFDKLVEVPAFKEQLEKAKASFVPASDEAIAAYKPLDTSVVGTEADAE